MKANTTEVDVAYEGPSILTNPSPKKIVERETEETTDKEQSNFQGSIAHIPPPVDPIQFLDPMYPKTLLSRISISLRDAKSSMEEPPKLELKDLPSHLEYAYLEENDKLPVIIVKDLKDDEKEALLKVLKSHKRAIAWKITDIKSGIEVDHAKVDVIAKLPHSTTVKGVRSFLGHAGFYRRFIQDFSKIARPMTHLLEKETPLVFSKDCINAFENLKKKLTEAPILVVPDWNLFFELMCDASNFAIGAVLGQRKTKHF
ncbi:reverse transcriptase domain-containing protein [Tanacetum coccineum]